MNLKLAPFALCLYLLCACSTPKNITYFQDLNNPDKQSITQQNNQFVPRICVGDLLTITVSALDPAAVAPFNLPVVSYPKQTEQMFNGTKEIGTSQAMQTYTVDSEGNIDFPIIGQIDTTGKTLEEVKAELTRKVSAYIKDPVVTVRLANFKVTVLGEVNRPGQYTIPEGQTTLLNAIGLAGDLTIYGKRDDILLVRNENSTITKERINLMDANFINSPYFQLKQGDVIYVSANQTKEKISRQDPNTNLYLAIAGTVIGLAGIFITIFKK